MIGLTTREVSEQLDVPASTLKTWIKSVPVPTTIDSLGNRRFSTEAIEMIKAIKQLRGLGCGFQTITRRIGLEPVASPSIDEPETNASSSKDEPPASDSPPLEQTAFIAQIVSAIREENELAEKYGRVAHQLGKLEQQVEYLTRENTQLQGELGQARRLLTDGSQGTEALQRRLDLEVERGAALEQQLNAERELRLQVEARLASAQQGSSPWWSKLFRPTNSQ